MNHFLVVWTTTVIPTRSINTHIRAAMTITTTLIYIFTASSITCKLITRITGTCATTWSVSTPVLTVTIVYCTFIYISTSCAFGRFDNSIFFTVAQGTIEEVGITIRRTNYKQNILY